MGLIESTEEQKGRFLSVSNGKLIMKVDEGTAGAKSRINKLGNTVWEKSYAELSGTLTGVRIEEGTYGEQIILTVDAGQVYNVCISMNSSYARSFFKSFHNIDKNKKLYMAPYSFVNQDGRKLNGITFKQDNIKINTNYPEGTPEVNGKEIKGKWLYDSIQQAEQVESLTEQVNKWISTNNLLTLSKTKEEAIVLTEEEQKELKQLKKNVKSETKYMDSDTFFDEL